MSKMRDREQHDLPRGEVLGDAEVTLRRVENVVSELTEHTEDHSASANATLARVQSVTERPDGVAGLVRTILSASAQISSVIEALRDSQEVLSQVAADRVQHTHAKLQEVSSATENAASSMLDGLDRALGLLDELEGCGRGSAREEEPDRSKEDSVRDELRDELHVLISLLQFQDITSQQLGYASEVLLDMETRLAKVADTLRQWGIPCDTTPAGEGPVEGTSPGDGSVNDPDATVDPGDRQSVADEIFL